MKGPKKGTHETFAENLPGLPDNIRKAKGGGYWLATGGIRKAPFSFIDFIGPYPFIRNAIAKVSGSIII